MRNNYGSGENEWMSSEYRYGEREEAVYRMPGELSARSYNLILGLTLIWGFGLNALFCIFFGDAVMTWNPGAILIGYFVSAFVGIFMNTRSRNPVVSFIGYNLVVLPIGLVLSIYISVYEVLSVIGVFLAAAAVALTMMLLSMVFPRLFLSIGPALGIALLVSILVELVLMIVGGAVYGGALDFVVAAIFCGYIGYDWAVAQRREFTTDNAIDSACALYLDIVNLFIRLLAIFGKRRRS